MLLGKSEKSYINTCLFYKETSKIKINKKWYYSIMLMQISDFFVKYIF